MTPTERPVAHKVLLVDDDDAVRGGMGSERSEQAAAVGAEAPSQPSRAVGIWGEGGPPPMAEDSTPHILVDR